MGFVRICTLKGAFALRKIRFAVAVSLILACISLAGCTKAWSYRFFFYDSMVNNWDFYYEQGFDNEFGCGPGGMVLHRVLAQSTHAYSSNIKVSVEFDLFSDMGNVLENLRIFFLDSELLEARSYFSVSFGSIGDESKDFHVLLEDTADTEPRVMASGDFLPPSMLTEGRNILDVEKTGQNVRCYMNGALFAEGELETYQSAFVVPMFGAVQDVEGYDYERLMKIRSVRIEYDGQRVRLPMFQPSAAGRSLPLIDAISADGLPHVQ